MVISLSVSYFFPEVSVGDGRNEGEKNKRKERKRKEKREKKRKEMRRSIHSVVS